MSVTQIQKPNQEPDFIVDDGISLIQIWLRLQIVVIKHMNDEEVVHFLYMKEENGILQVKDTISDNWGNVFNYIQKAYEVYRANSILLET